MSEFKVIEAMYLFSEMSDLRDEVLEVSVDATIAWINEDVGDGGRSIDELGTEPKAQMCEFGEGIERDAFGGAVDHKSVDVGE